jgi:hypothetical protein
MCGGKGWMLDVDLFSVGVCGGKQAVVVTVTPTVIYLYIRTGFKDIYNISAHDSLSFARGIMIFHAILETLTCALAVAYFIAGGIFLDNWHIECSMSTQ